MNVKKWTALCVTILLMLSFVCAMPAWAEDESEGAMCVLNLLTRIRVALLKDGVVGGQFVLKSPLEMIVYPDSTAPYYLGEMMTKWTMPIIESEVQQIWQ